ncbi:hypothetical protein [Polyangium fumosum]|uniref:Uncharacterized protein n=1 Tax=Polyangium fumosum TaxID=889272 RepID=A0A4U1IQA4_9BACT|nr:hypothetical protein [Polyangium fumosum]TKC96384.1 hypothetical protein E8A74_45585 [Polyangium fumosum]
MSQFAVLRHSWFRPMAAGALVTVAASCGADSLPDSPSEPSSASPAHATSTEMPKDLRAAYIHAVQSGAPEAYGALVTARR